VSDEESELPVELPRVPELADEMRQRFVAMSDRARTEVTHALNKWRATYRNGRQVLGVLNDRYDLWVFECARPAPWIAAGFDTQAGQGALVMAAFLPRGRPVSCRNCADLVARAVGESVVTLKCY